MKQIKKVSLIGALVLIISAVVLISGCSQAPAPAPTPAPAPEAEIEGTTWKYIANCLLKQHPEPVKQSHKDDTASHFSLQSAPLVIVFRLIRR